MATGFAAFRFALVGFSLPFMFIYRPELLLLSSGEEGLSIVAVVWAVVAAVIGIISLAAGLAGYLFTTLNKVQRGLMFVAAAFCLFPDTGISLGGVEVAVFDVLGALVLAGISVWSLKNR